jgi:hypothetical protein
MKNIHISANGQQSIYPDDQIRRLWQQGLLGDSALYWQEGMTEWRPLREYFAPASAHIVPPPFTRSRPSQQFAFTKDPSGLTVFLKTMLWISLAVGVICLFSDIAQLSLASSGSIAKENAESNDARQGMIGIIQLLTFIVTGIAFLMWIYRANLNATGFGAANMKFTPGWSVGYYFIPILCLFKPYQAMKETWQASTNPLAWNTQPGSSLLGWWWALWLISNVFGQLSFRLSLKVDSPSSLASATMASIMSTLVDIPLCLVAISLVSTIYKKQKALVEQIA